MSTDSHDSTEPRDRASSRDRVPSSERDVHEGEISLGKELRRAREVRGVTLEHIASETKIHERYLRALEADRLDLLPGRLYARNFIRTYAQFLGADEEELLDYFNYQSRLQENASGPASNAGVSEGLDRRSMAVAVLAAAILLILVVLTWSLSKGQRATTSEPPKSARPPILAQEAASLQAANEAPDLPVVDEGAPVRTTPSEGTPATSPAEATAGQVSSATPASGPEAEAGNTPAPPAVLASPSRPPPPVIVEDAEPAAPTGAPESEAVPAVPPPAPETLVPVVQLTFNEESWMELRRKGDAPLGSLQKAGTVVTYRLDKPLSIMIGNAGGVSCEIDGKPCKALGAAGEARTFKIDKDNFRAFLQ